MQNDRSRNGRSSKRQITKQQKHQTAEGTKQQKLKQQKPKTAEGTKRQKRQTADALQILDSLLPF
jgi:hypothetical protein